MEQLVRVKETYDDGTAQVFRIRESACVHVHPYGAISVGQKGEQLADLDAMAPEVIAFSDDGKGVQSESLMREAMEQCRRLGKILAAHCEDNSLLRGVYIHDGAYAKTTATGAFAPRASGARLRAMCAWQRRQAVHIMCVTSPRRKVFRSSRRQNGAA